ncbi:hypothetical protein C0991_006875 [Blastosporella zonata]|nr:hypothetical protein C0991_006875 [Blastosporella zonata]
MPPAKQPTRDQQPYTAGRGGMGQPFLSPIKRLKPQKPTQYVIPLGNAAKRRRLESELEALNLAAAATTSHSQPDAISETQPNATLSEPVPVLEPFDMAESSADVESGSPFKHFPESETPKPRCIVPN